MVESNNPQGLDEEQDSAIEDVAGVPTWPMYPTDTQPEPAIPPVGLNWRIVAERLGVDPRILEHDAALVFPGEYFPDAGFFVDPHILMARHVDVGDIALRPGYFIGDLTLSQFGIALNLTQDRTVTPHPVMRKLQGPVVGLFAAEQEAKRARDLILRGSLGSGVTCEAGPLGFELRVERPELLGRVATVMAGRGGAVISAGGHSLSATGSGAGATGPALPAEEGDAYRGGTGAAGDSEAPPTR
jgi:hypothetical protein